MPFKSEAQRKYLWANEPEIARDWTDTYGSGIQAAQGGRIGYQIGNMVGAEMEGAEMEGAMMQSQEVIKELYDALIAQGLSPQEAIEKIKEIIASSQAEGPQSPMMGEEFPGQEFRGGPRAPAAFGGIMDTYTGRRKYGLGSIFKPVKKAVKKLKKLASSKLGKIALGYVLTAGVSNYLAGAQGTFGLGAPGGQAWKSMKWLNPTNIVSNVGTSWNKLPFNKTSGVENIVGKAGQVNRTLADQSLAELVKETGALTEGQGIQRAINLSSAPRAVAPSFIPGVPNKVLAGVAGPSIAAGLYTAAQPPEELGGELDTEYDTKKADFDRYLAGLDTYEGGDFRVPVQYRAAQGGRIGYGSGTAYPDPNRVVPQGDLKTNLLNYFGNKLAGRKQVQPLVGGQVRSGDDFMANLITNSPEGVEQLTSLQSPDYKLRQAFAMYQASGGDLEFNEWMSRQQGAQGGRIGRQEGGLMDLGGMEKDYRDDGGFVPLGGEEKADDVPARLSKNEFVFTADAVRNAGGGDIDRGAEVMENVMKNLEAGGKVSEESQGQGAQEMFEVSERLSEVI